MAKGIRGSTIPRTISSGRCLNRLLARYVEGRGVLARPGFAAMKATQKERLFAEWLDPPEGHRNAMDAE
ncbi:MAG: hypothetical protein ABSD59_20975 [Terracidiphilus sp.]